MKGGGVSSKSVSLLTLYNNQDEINKKLLLKNKNKSCVLDSNQIDQLQSQNAIGKRTLSYKSLFSYEEALTQKSKSNNNSQSPERRIRDSSQEYKRSRSSRFRLVEGIRKDHDDAD